MYIEHWEWKPILLPRWITYAGIIILQPGTSYVEIYDWEKGNGEPPPDKVSLCNITLYRFKMSLKVVPNDLIQSATALFQTISWRRTGNKSLSEIMIA